MKTEREPNRREDGLFGPAHIVRSERAEISKQGATYVEGPRLLWQMTTYDLEGNKVEKIDYSADGIPIVRSVLIYDVRGRLAEKVEYDNHGSLSRKWRYIYEASGNLIEEALYTVDGTLLGRSVYTHEVGEGNIESISNQVFATHKAIRSYDIKGNRTELGTYVTEISHSARSVYNANENPTEITFYGEDGDTIRKIVFLYNAEEKPTEVADYIGDKFLNMAEGDPNGNGITLFLKSIYAYNTEGKRTKEAEYDAAGTLLNKKVYTYGIEGHKAMMGEYVSDGSLRKKESYTCEFDSYGNWTKETMLRWNAESGIFEPIMVTYRTIIYH